MGRPAASMPPPACRPSLLRLPRRNFPRPSWPQKNGRRPTRREPFSTPSAASGRPRPEAGFAPRSAAPGRGDSRRKSCLTGRGKAWPGQCRLPRSTHGLKGFTPSAAYPGATARSDGIRASRAARVAGALQEAECAASGRAEAEGAAGRWPAFPPLLQEQAGLASLVGECRAFGSRGNHDAGWRSRCLCSGRNNRKDPDTARDGRKFCRCPHYMVVFQAGRKAEGLLYATSVMVDVAGMRSLCGGIFPLVCDMCSVVIDINGGRASCTRKGENYELCAQR